MYRSAQLEILGVLRHFCGCVFTGLVHIISQLEECVCLFFSELKIVCSLWLLSSVLRVLWSCHKLPSTPLFLVVPGPRECAGSHLCSKTDKAETRPSGSPLKSQNTRLKLLHFFYPGRSWELEGVFVCLFHTRVEGLERVNPVNFPTGVSVASFILTWE